MNQFAILSFILLVTQLTSCGGGSESGATAPPSTEPASVIGVAWEAGPELVTLNEEATGNTFTFIGERDAAGEPSRVTSIIGAVNGHQAVTTLDDEMRPTSTSASGIGTLATDYSEVSSGILVVSFTPEEGDLIYFARVEAGTNAVVETWVEQGQANGLLGSNSRGGAQGEVIVTCAGVAAPPSEVTLNGNLRYSGVTTGTFRRPLTNFVWSGDRWTYTADPVDARTDFDCERFAFEFCPNPGNALQISTLIAAACGAIPSPQALVMCQLLSLSYDLICEADTLCRAFEYVASEIFDSGTIELWARSPLAAGPWLKTVAWNPSTGPIPPIEFDYTDACDFGEIVTVMGPTNAPSPDEVYNVSVRSNFADWQPSGSSTLNLHVWRDGAYRASYEEQVPSGSQVTFFSVGGADWPNGAEDTIIVNASTPLGLGFDSDELVVSINTLEPSTPTIGNIELLEFLPPSNGSAIFRVDINIPSDANIFDYEHVSEVYRDGALILTKVDAILPSDEIYVGWNGPDGIGVDGLWGQPVPPPNYQVGDSDTVRFWIRDIPTSVSVDEQERHVEWGPPGLLRIAIDSLEQLYWWKNVSPDTSPCRQYDFGTLGVSFPHGSAWVDAFVASFAPCGSGSSTVAIRVTNSATGCLYEGTLDITESSIGQGLAPIARFAAEGTLLPAPGSGSSSCSSITMSLSYSGRAY